MRHTLTFAAIALALSMPSIAADKNAAEPARWDVSAAHGPTTTAKFTTDEGTWLDLDVSPDGKQIAFSLLGDL